MIRNAEAVVMAHGAEQDRVRRSGMRHTRAEEARVRRPQLRSIRRVCTVPFCLCIIIIMIISMIISISISISIISISISISISINRYIISHAPLSTSIHLHAPPRPSTPLRTPEIYRRSRRKAPLRRRTRVGKSVFGAPTRGLKSSSCYRITRPRLARKE